MVRIQPAKCLFRQMCRNLMQSRWRTHLRFSSSFSSNLIRWCPVLKGQRAYHNSYSDRIFEFYRRMIQRQAGCRPKSSVLKHTKTKRHRSVRRMPSSEQLSRDKDKDSGRRYPILVRQRRAFYCMGFCGSNLNAYFARALTCGGQPLKSMLYPLRASLIKDGISG